MKVAPTCPSGRPAQERIHRSPIGGKFSCVHRGPHRDAHVAGKRHPRRARRGQRCLSDHGIGEAPFASIQSAGFASVIRAQKPPPPRPPPCAGIAPVARRLSAADAVERAMARRAPLPQAATNGAEGGAGRRGGGVMGHFGMRAVQPAGGRDGNKPPSFNGQRNTMRIAGSPWPGSSRAMPPLDRQGSSTSAP